jgi:3-ketosteroid 9alpha-monooxygenase subunit A
VIVDRPSVGAEFGAGEVHVVEGFPYSSFPTGWFQFAWSAEIAPGEVRSMRYFDRELVCYRGESGDLHVMDGHCLHLGAHLGHGGTVEGDCIRCPFHGWRWDSSGANADIPYGKRKNFNLRTTTYPVEEIDGVALMWFSPSGAQPHWKPPMITAPNLPSDYFDIYPHCARTDRLRFVPQMVVENTVDFPHLKWVHRWEAEEPELVGFEADGHRFTATMRGSLQTRKGTSQLETTMNHYGIGFAIAPINGLRPMIQIYSAIPVDHDHCDVRMTMFVTVPDGVDPSVPDNLAQGMIDAQAREALDKRPGAGDRNIWEHMRYVQRPPLVQEEMPATKAVRRWAAQFYES